MTNREKTAEEKLETLLDTMANDVLSASDEEILSEATSDFKDPAEEANKIRMGIRKAALSSGPQDLNSVKRFYANTHFEVLEIPSDKPCSKINCGISQPLEFKMVAGNFCAPKASPEKSSLVDSQIQKALEKKK